MHARLFDCWVLGCVFGRCVVMLVAWLVGVLFVCCFDLSYVWWSVCLCVCMFDVLCGLLLFVHVLWVLGALCVCLGGVVGCA